MRRKEPPVAIHCPQCHCLRFVSRRQGRRYEGGIGMCRACSRGRAVQLNTEPILRRWLEAFDDESILAMARGVWTAEAARSSTCGSTDSG